MMALTAAILTLLVVGFAVLMGVRAAPPAGSTFSAHFLTADRLSDFEVVSTLAATNTALALIVFWFSYLGWLYGLGAAFWLIVCWIAGLGVFWALQGAFSEFYPPSASNDKLPEPPFQTMHEFAARGASGQWPRRSLAGVSIVTFLLMMNVELTRGVRIFDGLTTGQHQHWIDVLALAVLLGAAVYAAWGGFSAVLRTDEWQWFFTAVALLIALGLAGTALGDPSRWFGSVFAPQGFSAREFFLLPAQPWFILGSLFSWAFWFLVTMDMWQRAAAARRINILSLATMKWLVPWFILLTITAVLIGVSVRVALPNDFTQTFPAVTFLSIQMERLAGWGVPGVLLFGMMVAGFASAMVSTLDTYFVTVAHAILRDLPDRTRSLPWTGRPFPRWFAGVVTVGIALAIFPTYLVVAHSSLSINALLYLATTSPFILLPAVLFGISSRGRGVALIGSAAFGVVGCAAVIGYVLSQIAVSAPDDVGKWYNYMYLAPLAASGVALFGYLLGWAVRGNSDA